MKSRHASPAKHWRSRRLSLALVLITASSSLGCGSSTAIDPGTTATPGERSILELEQGVYISKPQQFQNLFTSLEGVTSVLVPEDESPTATTVDLTKLMADSGYLGAEACRDCHTEIYESSLETAHFRTLRPATRELIDGPLDPPHNRLQTSNPEMRFEMFEEGGRPWQKLVLERGDTYSYRMPIDLISGSGKAGQSYLSWSGENLYQLPVSYIRAGECWSNSPGYPEGSAVFARPIIERCLECHATWVHRYPDRMNQYARETLIPGITCEKCHGPGHRHVELQLGTARPGTVDTIVNPANLHPDLSRDVCRLCHSGTGESLKNSFTYRPGQRLDALFRFNESSEAGPGGVHTANQMQRLRLSRCFQSTVDMTCTACHDPHRNERGQLELFAQRCATCHQPESCRTAVDLGPAGTTGCVDCHMPLHRDQSISLEDATRTIAPLMRDHYIRILPAADPPAKSN